MSVLEITDLSIRFGGLQALQDVAITVNEFEIVGLIGPNGAGKTTAFNCITGFYQPDTGTVLYRGQDVTRTPPYQKATMGFGRTFQNVGMVKSSTVLDNLKTAQHGRVQYGAAGGLLGGRKVRSEERALEAKADALLELLGLTEFRDKRVGGLSYGTLKLLELGCALATEPDILLLDEPSSGMGPEESNALGRRLLELRKAFGLTMLLIEHHVPLVLSVCDHVYVLNFGRLLAEGKPSVIQTHPEVVAAYLGGAPLEGEPLVEAEPAAEPVAVVEPEVPTQLVPPTVPVRSVATRPATTRPVTLRPVTTRAAATRPPAAVVVKPAAKAVRTKPAAKPAAKAAVKPPVSRAAIAKPAVTAPVVPRPARSRKTAASSKDVPS